MNRDNFLKHMETASKCKIHFYKDHEFDLGEINYKELRYHLTHYIHKFGDRDVHFSINNIKFTVFMFGECANGALCEYNLIYTDKTESFLKKDILLKAIVAISKGGK